MSSYPIGSDLFIIDALTDPVTGLPITSPPTQVTFEVQAPTVNGVAGTLYTYTLTGHTVTQVSVDTYKVLQHFAVAGAWKWSAWSDNPRGRANGVIVITPDALYTAG